MRMLYRSLPTLRLCLAMALLAALCGTGVGAQAAALVTIVDGEANLIDGDRSVLAAEGLKVADQTLVRTSPRSNLLRVEWADGTVADFGPDTQAMLSPAAFGPRAGRAPAVYLLRGWVKLSAMGSAAAPGLLTPHIDVQPFKGAVLVMAAGGETWVFAESGSASMIERDLKPATNLALKNGEVYLRNGGAKGAVSARPAPAQMQRVPRGFRDALPLRYATLKDKAAPAKPGPAPVYSDVREWLLVEAPVRKPFAKRFADRVKDPAFRTALTENLSQHPEWEPVLFPERFTKPATAPR